MAALPPPSHTVSLMSLLRWPLWLQLVLLRDMGVPLALCCPGLCLCALGLILLGTSIDGGWLSCRLAYPHSPFLGRNMGSQCL